MTSRERSSRRDLLYSRWHREDQLGRVMSKYDAYSVSAIDIDWAEYCRWCNRTLALIETKNSARSPVTFTATVTKNLGDDAGKPAYCVTYTCGCGVTGAEHETQEECDIVGFKVLRLNPDRCPSVVTEMSPDTYALWLLELHAGCGCRTSEGST